MSRENPGAFPLFDLLARRWRLPAPATALRFNASSSAAAVALIDGRVALFEVADAEPPEKRIVSDEAGRRTIAPRQGEPRPAIVLPARGEASVRIACVGKDRFVVARGDGGVSWLAADGSEAAAAPSDGPVLALDHAQDRTVIVTAAGIEVRDRHGGAQRGGADWGARAAAISPDGARLAFGCADALVLTNSAKPFEIVRRYPCPQAIETILWRADGAYLVATCGQSGLALLDTLGDRFGALGDFPTPPRAVAFSLGANALVASGAFRIAAWDLARPPFAGDRSGALETGRPGLVPVAEVAAHPQRKLVAAAYANGQIVIAELGGRDELILQAAGLEPSAFVWSGDGKTLAIAAGDRLSLVSLPDALFK